MNLMERVKRIERYNYYKDYIDDCGVAYKGIFKAYRDVNGWYVLKYTDSNGSIFSHWDWNVFFEEFNKIF